MKTPLPFKNTLPPQPSMPDTKLKPYMIFSAHGGPTEGAVLGFGLTGRKLRKDCFKGEFIDYVFGFIEEFVDIRVRLIRETWPYALLPAAHAHGNRTYIIDDYSTITCKSCELWSLLNKDGFCESCYELL